MSSISSSPGANLPSYQAAGGPEQRPQLAPAVGPRPPPTEEEWGVIEDDLRKWATPNLGRAARKALEATITTALENGDRVIPISYDGPGPRSDLFSTVYLPPAPQEAPPAYGLPPAYANAQPDVPASPRVGEPPRVDIAAPADRAAPRGDAAPQAFAAEHVQPRPAGLQAEVDPQLPRPYVPHQRYVPPGAVPDVVPHYGSGAIDEREVNGQLREAFSTLDSRRVQVAFNRLKGGLEANRFSLDRVKVFVTHMPEVARELAVAGPEQQAKQASSRALQLYVSLIAGWKPLDATDREDILRQLTCYTQGPDQRDGRKLSEVFVGSILLGILQADAEPAAKVRCMALVGGDHGRLLRELQKSSDANARLMATEIEQAMKTLAHTQALLDSRAGVVVTGVSTTVGNAAKGSLLRAERMLDQGVVLCSALQPILGLTAHPMPANAAGQAVQRHYYAVPVGNLQLPGIFARVRANRAAAEAQRPAEAQKPAPPSPMLKCRDKLIEKSGKAIGDFSVVEVKKPAKAVEQKLRDLISEISTTEVRTPEDADLQLELLASLAAALKEYASSPVARAMAIRLYRDMLVGAASSLTERVQAGNRGNVQNHVAWLKGEVRVFDEDLERANRIAERDRTDPFGLRKR